MPASLDKNFGCACGAMRVDWDAFRFGSKFGDLGILVYRRELVAT